MLRNAVREMDEAVLDRFDQFWQSPSLAFAPFDHRRIEIAGFSLRSTLGKFERT